MKSKRHRSPRADTMKCIRTFDGWVKRVSNTEADREVANGMAVYIPKNEWKSWQSL